MNKIDPVCRCHLGDVEPAGRSYFGGEKFYFCSDTCKSKFNRSPFQFFKSSTGMNPREIREWQATVALQYGMKG